MSNAAATASGQQWHRTLNARAVACSAGGDGSGRLKRLLDRVACDNNKAPANAPGFLLLNF